MNKYLKTFESFINDKGELQGFENKIVYPSKKVYDFVQWFTSEYSDYMDKQGWTLSNINTGDVSDDYVSDDDTVYQVQVVDCPEEFYQDETGKEIEGNALCGIGSDIEAWALATKVGLMLDDNGILIGYDDTLFI